MVTAWRDINQTSIIVFISNFWGGKSNQSMFQLFCQLNHIQIGLYGKYQNKKNKVKMQFNKQSLRNNHEPLSAFIKIMAERTIYNASGVSLSDKLNPAVSVFLRSLLWSANL